MESIFGNSCAKLKKAQNVSAKESKFDNIGRHIISCQINFSVSS